METDDSVFLVSNLVLNHAADLRQEVLADDTVEVTVLWRGFVPDAFCQTDPLFFCITHKGPSTPLTTWQKQRGDMGSLIQRKMV